MWELADYEGRIAKVDGPARSGKTEVLVRRCVRLLEQGVDASSILVVASTGLACAAFRERLRRAAGERLLPSAEGVVVRRALDVCAAVLDDPAARALTGRTPRVLNDGEYAFFLEDLKTIGQKSRRLRNMLMFFYAQWSKFEDEAAWLIPGEETVVLERARFILRGSGAMLRHELPYVCGMFLKSEQGRPFAHRYAYVLCDDFQNLSRAEQVCMALCAGKQLIVTGNAAHATKANTDYPCPEGFERFERLRRNVDVFELDGAWGVEAALGVEAAMGDPAAPRRAVRGTSGTSVFVEWETPEEELAHLPRVVEEVRTAHPDLAFSDFAVAVPNRRWGAYARKALERRGIPTCGTGLGVRLGGDLREPGRHDALTAYVALCLAADPCDVVAWRAWTGFDNAIANSETWGSLYRLAEGRGAGFYATLKEVAEGSGPCPEVLKVEALRRSWAEGQRVVERCRGLHGAELFCAAGLDGCAPFAGVLAALRGDEDAAGLLGLVRAVLSSPCLPEAADAVRVALYENLCGLECACLVAPGMVDGMVPHRDAYEPSEPDSKRRRIVDEDRTRVRSFIARATRILAVSAFERADIEVAERSKMRVVRVCSVGGRRTALLAPAPFFAQAGDAFPGFEKGSQVDLAAALGRG